MVYQNNNNRIVPNEVLNLNLQPQASPVNQEIKYQVDLSAAKRAEATGDALAKIGQGVLDIDLVLQKKAEASIIDAEMKTWQEGKNKQDWADVSKNVKGLAKFNPYIHDAYKSYVSNDLANIAYIQLMSDPLIQSGKISKEQYSQKVQSTIGTLMDSYKQLGFKPNDYEQYLERFNKQIQNIDLNYATKNNEYSYNNTLIQAAHNTALTLASANSGVTDETVKLKNIQEVLNTTITDMSSLGVPDDEIAAKVIGQSIQEYAVINADKGLDSATLITALNTVKINGKALDEIVPNYTGTIQKMLRDARVASFQERKLDFDIEKFEREKAADNAMIDIFNYLKQNPSTSSTEIEQLYNSVIDKYGVTGIEGLQFLQSVDSLRNFNLKLRENKTDPDTELEIAAKAAAGTLTRAELAQAVEDGNLSANDMLKYDAKIEKNEKENQTEAKQIMQRQRQQYLTKNKGDYSSLDIKTRKDIESAHAQIAQALENGMPASEAKRQLALLDKAIEQKKTEKQIQSKNYSLLLQGKYRSSVVTPSYNMSAAKSAITQMGILRNNVGVRDTNININRGYTNDRNNDGKKGDTHTGFDFNNVWKGRAVYPPCDGEIISSGDGGTMGFYVLFKDTKKGRYMLVQHCDRVMPKGKVTRNTPLAYVGNTGHIESRTKLGAKTPCLHVEWWDSQLKLVSPDKW